MIPLPNDYTRCYGMHCTRKQQCQRFTTIRIDPIEVLPYVSTMIDERDECDAFINEQDTHND